MAENDAPEGEKKRVEIGDLPTGEKELTDEEAKKLKGGGWLMSPAGNAKPDGSGN